MLDLRLLTYFVAMVVLNFHSASTIAQEVLPEHFYAERVLSNLNRPIYLTTLPDGEMMLLEKGGKIKIFDPAASPAFTRTVLTLPDVDRTGERGLSSVALDPSFSGNGYLYAYYQHKYTEETTHSRIIRLSYDPVEMDINDAVLVWENNEPAHDCCHYGGGLGFGPDDMLYLTTGEEFQPEQSQDLTRAGGKILRLNVGGISEQTPWIRGEHNAHAIPNDNPVHIADGPGGNLDEIWAYGLRNPFRAHWDLPSGHFYIGDVGGNVRRTAIESLELGKAGANYGWPQCEGVCGDPELTQPLYSYAHTDGPVALGSVIGSPAYRATQFPEKFRGAVFLADFARENIQVMRVSSGGSFESIEDFITDGVNSPVSLAVGPDGGLYVVNFLEQTVTRYVYSKNRVKPNITEASASIQSGSAPLTVKFKATAGSATGSDLQYTWHFGDGSVAEGRTASRTYNSNGTFEAYVTVSDAELSAASSPIELAVGNAPVITITQPLANSTFTAGETIRLSAIGSDDNDTLSDDQFHWDIEFLHDEHAHPVKEFIGPEAELTIPSAGHDYFGKTGYRVSLSVTDSDGLATSASVDMLPEKVDLILNSSPSGIGILVDGLPYATPVTYDTVVDFKHLMTADLEVCHEGLLYEFSHWSDGGDITHALTAPAQGLNLRAYYHSADACFDDPTLATTSDGSTSPPLKFVQSLKLKLGTDLVAAPDALLVSEKHVLVSSRHTTSLSWFDRDDYYGLLEHRETIAVDVNERLSADTFVPSGAMAIAEDDQLIALGNMFHADECPPGDQTCGVSTIASFELTNTGLVMVDRVERSEWIASPPGASLKFSHDGRYLFETMQQDGLPGLTTYSISRDLEINRIRNSTDIAIYPNAGRIEEIQFSDSSSVAINRLSDLGSIITTLKYNADDGSLVALADYDVSTLLGFQRVYGIALSSDGGTLYAALSDGIENGRSAVARFNIDDNGQIELEQLLANTGEDYPSSAYTPGDMTLAGHDQQLYVANRETDSQDAKDVYVYNVHAHGELVFAGTSSASSDDERILAVASAALADGEQIDGAANEPARITLSDNQAYLYVADDQELTVFAVHSDLLVEASAPQSALVDETLDAKFRIYNAGPARSQDIRLAIISSSEISHVSDAESCRVAGISVVCEFEGLSSRESIDIGIETQSSVETELEFTATVSQLTTDLKSENDSTTTVTRIVDDSKSLIESPNRPAVAKPSSPALAAATSKRRSSGCSVESTTQSPIVLLLVCMSSMMLYRRRRVKLRIHCRAIL